jgi:alpha-L-rhamnosidase
VATPDTYPDLWKKLVNQFGPMNIEDNAFPKVYPANAFIGNYLRLELLSRNNENAKILSETVGFFNYMAEQTGTLWEKISSKASCNHGFASHVVFLFYRDVLGIYDVNTVEKKITIQFPNVDIESCQGKIPVGDDIVSLEWKKNGDEIIYELKAPENYQVEIKNLSGSKLVRR